MNREALVVADRHALELVEGSQASARDGVELATDPVAPPGEVDQVRTALAEERVGLEGDIVSEENGVVPGDNVGH